MKERGIIMAAESVRAILAGTKSQTRRLAKPEDFGGVEWCSLPTDLAGLWRKYARPRHPRLGEAGDRLWVKEAIAIRGDIDPTTDLDKALHYLIYRADRRDDDLSLEWHNYGPGWRSPLFMPRWVSRLTLEIVEVRVQRLQEISEDDAKAEGVEQYTPPHGHISPEQRVPGPGCERARLGDQPHRLPFADRWDAINGKRRRREYLSLGDPGYTVDRPWRTVVDESAAWAANPWVFALTFRRLP